MAAGFVEEQRFTHNSEPCNPCESEAAKGRQPIGTLAKPGEDCDGMTNCRCTMDYYKADGTEAALPVDNNKKEKTGFDGSIRFEDDTAFAGRAEYGGNIAINRNTYNKADAEGRRGLVAHEIGHHTIDNWIIDGQNFKEWDIAEKALTVREFDDGRKLFVFGNGSIGEAIADSMAYYLGDLTPPPALTDKIQETIRAWAKGTIKRSPYRESVLKADIKKWVKKLDKDLANG